MNLLEPIVYFRMTDMHDEPEFQACNRHFKTVTQRTHILPRQLVIPRYTSLPFGKELELDIKTLGAELINTFRQHCYVAEMRNWYQDFEDITPKTWFRLQDIMTHPGPFVLKGSTNSKKFSWNTHMFAKDHASAGDVYMRLLDDGLTGTQEIVIREFVKLRNYGTMPSGIPISHEFRCFFYKDQLLSKAYYWSNEDITPEDNIPKAFIEDVARRGKDNINFWVADLAQTEDGSWIVVELNDGCMSGLSRNDPDVLYSRLKEELNR